MERQILGQNFLNTISFATMAEQEDATDSKPVGEIRGGSIPSSGTNFGQVDKGNWNNRKT